MQQPARARAATSRSSRHGWPAGRRPRRSAAARCRAWPSAVAFLAGRRGARLGEEFLDEASLAIVGHRLADDLAGRPEGQIRDLGAEIRDRPLLLRFELGARPGTDPLELLAGRGQVTLTRLLGDLLRPGQDVIR